MFRLTFSKCHFQQLRMMSSASNRINIKVEQGVLSGVQEKLPNGKPMYAFKGIPYAEPPERFKAPKKLEKFKVPVLDCSEERDICFQRNTFGKGFIGAEDCLFLNVYTPQLEKDSSKGKFPVMIFIHGGAYQWGSGNSDFYSPEYIVQENVIIVTLNYRLHVLGFSALQKGGIVPNIGLKDQLMAIKWVNENIEQFNGDPKNITLFGESAGAASVHLHVLSKNSRKYFQKAICQSGNAFGDWAFKIDVEEKTRMLGKCLGCKGNSDQEIYETLKNVDLKEIEAQAMKVMTPDEKRRTLPFVFKPTVEDDLADALLSKTPLQLMQEQRDEIGIDMIFGSNDRDGMIMIMDAVKKLDMFDNDPVRFIPMSVNVNPMSTNGEKLGEEIKKFYFGDKPVCKETIYQLSDFMTDFHFKNCQLVATELHARYQHNAKTFVYDFGVDGQLNMFKKLFQLDIPGACHADELFYLFQVRFKNFFKIKQILSAIQGKLTICKKPFICFPFTESISFSMVSVIRMRLFEMTVNEKSPEYKMRALMCKLWTNFAKYGNPTPDNQENPLPFKWEPLKPVNPTAKDVTIESLQINHDLKMVQNPYKERVEFWKNVYKKWNDNFLNPKL